MTLARFALSSLYFRSSPLPDPSLPVVATLFVCVVIPTLPSVERSVIDSGRDADDEPPDASDATDASDGSRPLSTIVGRRERVGGVSAGGKPPYTDIVCACVWLRSCMSRRYDITERSARIRASRARSSSCRRSSSKSVASGLGTGGAAAAPALRRAASSLRDGGRLLAEGRSGLSVLGAGAGAGGSVVAMIVVEYEYVVVGRQGSRARLIQSRAA